MKQKHVNASMVPVDLEGGRMVAPGEEAIVDTTVDHNKRLIEDGVLIPVISKKEGDS